MCNNIRNRSIQSCCCALRLIGFWLSAVFILFDGFYFHIKVIGNEVKVVDLIQFNGDILAYLRFKYLESVVDYFVVVEGAYTFTGIRKEKLFMDLHADWFTELERKNKLLKVVYYENPLNNSFHHNNANHVLDSTSTLHHESFQKDYAAEKILQHFGNTSFVLIVCDADEIPKREFVSHLSDNYEDMNSGAFLDMVYFYYNFRWVKNTRWQRAMVLNDRLLRKSRNDKITLHELRMIGEFTVIKNAGWHCSYCTSTEKIMHKYLHSSSAHPHSNDSNNNNNSSSINSSNISSPSQWINNCIDNGIDLFLRKESHEQLSPYDGKLGYPILPGVVDVLALQNLQSKFTRNGTFLGFTEH